MQLQKGTLINAIKKAEYVQPGTVFSVKPINKSGKILFEVLVAYDGKVVKKEIF